MDVWVCYSNFLNNSVTQIIVHRDRLQQDPKLILLIDYFYLFVFGSLYAFYRRWNFESQITNLLAFLGGIAHP